MDTETELSAYRPAPEKTGMNTVRARAKTQHCVRLRKGDDSIVSTSYENLRVLKNISAIADEEKDRELLAEPSWICRLWGMFQEAIGNR